MIHLEEGLQISECMCNHFRIWCNSTVGGV